MNNVCQSLCLRLHHLAFERLINLKFNGGVIILPSCLLQLQAVLLRKVQEVASIKLCARIASRLLEQWDTRQGPISWASAAPTDAKEFESYSQAELLQLHKLLEEMRVELFTQAVQYDGLQVRVSQRFS